MPKKRVDTTRLQRIARAYTESAVLFAALDLELFTHVAHGQDTEEKLARAMDVPALNAKRLVTACLAMGLLEWDGQTLGNAPDAQRFLVVGIAIPHEGSNMHRFLVVSAFFCAAVSSAAGVATAYESAFPYEVQTVSADVPLRCGPGNSRGSRCQQRPAGQELHAVRDRGREERDPVGDPGDLPELRRLPGGRHPRGSWQ